MLQDKNRKVTKGCFALHQNMKIMIYLKFIWRLGMCETENFQQPVLPNMLCYLTVNVYLLSMYFKLVLFFVCMNFSRFWGYKLSDLLPVSSVFVLTGMC